MQRITRTEQAYPAASPSTHVSAWLSQHCPAHLANLFAIPRAGAGEILEWWSPLGGQPQPYHSLSQLQQQELLKLYQQRQASLQELANQLKTQNPQATNPLQGLLGDPNLNNLYSLDQQPVLINWDSQPPIAPPTPVAPPIAAELNEVPVTSQQQAKKSRLWLWLLLLLFLLLLLLGLLAWWLFCNQQKKPEAMPVAPITLPVQTPPEPKIEPQPVPEPEPEPITPAEPDPEPIIVKPDAPTAPALPPATPEKPVANQPQPSKPAPAKPAAAPRKFNKIENFACASNPTQPPPEFVVVFDTSSSMNAPYPGSMRTYLDTSKDSLRSMLNNLHPRIDTRFIHFTGWCDVKDAGIFSGGQRSQLINYVNSLSSNSATPISPALLKAAARVNGISRDALIVLFIDGAGNCGENVCAVAQRLAKMKPRLQVNVVDVTGTGEAQCIANATKGRVYTPKNASQISAQLLDATKEIGKQCKQ